MEAAEAEGLADDLVELSLGDTVRCGRFSLTVLWPERLADDGGNADSLCLLAFWDGDGDGAAEWTALFTGDAEAEQLGQLSDRLPAGGVDVLKVGHHGSKKSLDASLAERLSPAVRSSASGSTTATGIRPGRCSTCWTRRDAPPTAATRRGMWSWRFPKIRSRFPRKGRGSAGDGVQWGYERQPTYRSPSRLFGRGRGRPQARGGHRSSQGAPGHDGQYGLQLRRVRRGVGRGRRHRRGLQHHALRQPRAPRLRAQRRPS